MLELPHRYRAAMSRPRRTAMTRICWYAGALLLMAGCASLPRGSAGNRHPSTAMVQHDGKLQRAFTTPRHAHADESGFKMLAAGVDGLTTRLEVIDSAEHSLDLQYYIFRADVSGTLVAQALLRAADRGVRVRLLIDDGDTVKGDEKIFALAAHSSIEVRVFNPFDYRGHDTLRRGLDFLLHKSRLDYRMHNKLLIADNAVAMVGGRNIGDQYFQINPDSQFGDTDVVAAGSIIQHLSNVFDQFWNDEQSVPVRDVDGKRVTAAALDEFRRSTDVPAPLGQFHTDLLRRLATGEPFAGILAGRTPLSWAPAQVIYDSPDKYLVANGEQPGKLIYQPMQEQIDAVRKELLMVTPYFVPSAEELGLLTGLKEKHARVSILTNSLEAAPNITAHAGYTHFRRTLLQDGVELHEIKAMPGNSRGSGESKSLLKYGNYALHAKLYVFDRKSLFVGSMNFDRRSRHLNTEIGLMIHSGELATQAAARFESLIQPSNAYELQLRDSGAGKSDRLTWHTEEAGVPKVYTTEPARNAWQRLKMQTLALLPIDDEL